MPSYGSMYVHLRRATAALLLVALATAQGGPPGGGGGGPPGGGGGPPGGGGGLPGGGGGPPGGGGGGPPSGPTNASCSDAAGNGTYCMELYFTTSLQCGVAVNGSCIDCSTALSDTDCIGQRDETDRPSCVFNFAMNRCMSSGTACHNVTQLDTCLAPTAHDRLRICAWAPGSSTCQDCSILPTANCPVPRCAIDEAGRCTSPFALCSRHMDEAPCLDSATNCFWDPQHPADDAPRCMWCGNVEDAAHCNDLAGRCEWDTSFNQCVSVALASAAAAAAASGMSTAATAGIAVGGAGAGVLLVVAVCCAVRASHRTFAQVDDEGKVLTTTTSMLRLTLPKSVGSTGSAPTSAMMAPALFQEGRVQRLKLLGRGANGSVYSCVLPDGTIIAMKEVLLPQSAIESTGVVDEVMKEVSIVSSLDHPNVVRFYGSALEQEEGRLTIFMELVPSGSLASMVRAMPQAMSEDLACVYAKQITSALAYVHSCGVVHRDMKCDNLLLTPDGCIKLTDFGASKLVGVGTVGTKNAQTMIGTPVYMAPEVLLAGEDETVVGYGKRADVWSLGITILEMLEQGNAPWPSFPSTGAAFMHISSPDALPIIPERLSETGKDFLRRCCIRDPAKRAKSEDLLEHEWIRDVVIPLHRDGTAGSFTKMQSSDLILPAPLVPLSSGPQSQQLTTSISASM